MNTNQEPAPAKDLMSEGPPLLSVDGSVATICLRRPAERNNLHDEDLHSLLDMFSRLDKDEQIRVVALTAQTYGQAKPVFCAGYRMDGFGSGQHDAFLFERVSQALSSIRPLTVCAVNGSVYGGATDLVLACDIRVALAGSVWRMPAAAIGLHYYPSGLRRYVQILGPALSKNLFLTARPMDVERLAAVAGLFVDVLPADKFDAGVSTLIEEIRRLSPLAAQLTKRSLDEIATHDFDESTLRAREAVTLASSDFAEGRASFKQRRMPAFTGR